MQSQYNMRSPAVKRLMKEAQELSQPTEQYHVQPLDDNLFEWHFTIRGPADSDFDGGIYHGRIILPPDYPMKPPSIILLTPNGRFEIFKKICLSISGHHPESWQPSWSIRTALLAIIGFMPTHGAGAIGSLDYTPEERKVLAKKSQDWKCQNCGAIGHILPPVTQASEKTTQEAKELATQIDFQGEKVKNSDTSADTSKESSETSFANQGTKTSVLSTTPTTASETSTPTTPNAQLTQFPWNAFMAGAPPQMMPPYGLPFPMQYPPGNPNQMVPRFPLPCYAPMFPPQMYPGYNLTNNSGWLPQQPTLNIPPESPKTSASTVISTNSTNTTTSHTTSSSSQLASTNTTTVTSTSTVTTSSPTPSSPPTTRPPPTSTNTDPQTTSTDGPRRRTGASPPPQINPTIRQAFQSANLPPQRSDGKLSLVLIIILICAIGLLVFRRLYLSFEWNLLFR
ncbi:ubiquitin-conjugating enzyme E2 J1 isoform X1 [Patella vulgata]|uniref:ubiquitin-conjugating enzyme E2 J1 isoform X1 n=2 Tax=Patella vulgata TaxID=6465 RepID=UPI0024A875FD|nr:ubiquitin-conjugating enzyme E2 J1 isoform X1 [Patella vulgata]